MKMKKTKLAMITMASLLGLSFSQIVVAEDDIICSGVSTESNPNYGPQGTWTCSSGTEFAIGRQKTHDYHVYCKDTSQTPNVNFLARSFHIHCTSSDINVNSATQNPGESVLNVTNNHDETRHITFDNIVCNAPDETIEEKGDTKRTGISVNKCGKSGLGAEWSADSIAYND